MRSVHVIIPFAFIAQAHAMDSTDNSVDRLADSMVDNFFDRAVERIALHSRYFSDMEDTTLGKPGQAAMGTSGLAQPSSVHAATRSFSACRLAPLSPATQQRTGLPSQVAPQLILPAGRPQRSRFQSTPSAVAEKAQQIAATAESGAGHAVILQNKDGNTKELGYHLAKELKAKGMKVTLLQEHCKQNEMPFKLYETDLLLPDVWVQYCVPWKPESFSNLVSRAITKADPRRKGKWKPKAIHGPVTHIFDNYSNGNYKKGGMESLKPVIEIAKSSPDFKLYSYISNAAVYRGAGEMSETSPVKDDKEKSKSAGARKIEIELNKELPGKVAIFRPQYIYGEHGSKRDYLDWFLARSNFDKPLGVPGDGSQPVNLAHCEDVASLVSSVVGKEDAAGGEVFNCGTSDTVTYKAVCEAAGKAFEKEPTIVETPAGKWTSFPFSKQAEGFYINVNKAKEKLGWAGPKHNVLDDISPDGFYTKSFLDSEPKEDAFDYSKDGLEEAGGD